MRWLVVAGLTRSFLGQTILLEWRLQMDCPNYGKKHGGRSRRTRMR